MELNLKGIISISNIKEQYEYYNNIYGVHLVNLDELTSFDSSIIILLLKIFNNNPDANIINIPDKLYNLAQVYSLEKFLIDDRRN